MKEKSTVLVCISILIGFIILGLAIYFKPVPVQEQHKHYQMVSHGNSIFIFDNETGECWKKFSNSNEAPTEWEKQVNPVS